MTTRYPLKEKNKIRDKLKDFERIISSVCEGDYNQLYSISYKESKQHDLFRFGNSRGISIPFEARLFAIHEILRFLYTPEDAPQVIDILYIRNSIFYGYAIATRHRNELLNVLDEDDARYLLSVDYCKLI